MGKGVTGAGVGSGFGSGVRNVGVSVGERVTGDSLGDGEARPTLPVGASVFSVLASTAESRKVSVKTVHFISDEGEREGRKSGRNVGCRKWVKLGGKTIVRSECVYIIMRLSIE